MYKRALLVEFENRKSELSHLVEKINVALTRYRKGTLVIQNDYAYIKHYEGGKVLSTYVGKHLSEEDISNIKRELKNYKTLERTKKDYLKEINELDKMINKYKGANL